MLLCYPEVMTECLSSCRTARRTEQEHPLFPSCLGFSRRERQARLDIFGNGQHRDRNHSLFVGGELVNSSRRANRVVWPAIDR